jgi:hypothetical protein
MFKEKADAEDLKILDRTVLAKEYVKNGNSRVSYFLTKSI